MSKVNDFLTEAGVFFLATAMLEGLPEVKKLYEANPGYKMMTFHIEDATAVDIAVMGDGEDLLS